VDEFDFHVGLNTMFAGINNGFIMDDFYQSSNSNGMYFETPICLNFGIGKYFRQQHFVGLEFDLKAIGGPQTFFQSGVNYKYYYDAMKSDVARYIPLKVAHHNFSTIETFRVPDMTMPPLPTYTERDFAVDIQSLNIGIGHGWSFIVKDKHYWNIELLFYRGFWSKHSFISNGLSDPKISYQTAGAQLNLGFHF
jgi:hypothetical protein